MKKEEECSEEEVTSEEEEESGEGGGEEEGEEEEESGNEEESEEDESEAEVEEESEVEEDESEAAPWYSEEEEAEEAEQRRVNRKRQRVDKDGKIVWIGPETRRERNTPVQDLHLLDARSFDIIDIDIEAKEGTCEVEALVAWLSTAQATLKELRLGHDLQQYAGEEDVIAQLHKAGCVFSALHSLAFCPPRYLSWNTCSSLPHKAAEEREEEDEEEEEEEEPISMPTFGGSPSLLLHIHSIFPGLQSFELGGNSRIKSLPRSLATSLPLLQRLRLVDCPAMLCRPLGEFLRTARNLQQVSVEMDQVSFGFLRPVSCRTRESVDKYAEKLLWIGRDEAISNC
ncbi:Phosphodiesterase, variant 2 [Balamuthia mandrillaris]